MTPSTPSGASAQAQSGWSAQDIAEGRARCAALLKDLDLVAVPAEPIWEVRDGETCGTPAPMQLVSVGSRPQITFSPPAVLTCDMIAALHKWLTADVQPLARKHLGAPVTGVTTMSSFSCRNAYSRAKTKLSEHARVNALDLGAFVTERGDKAMVVADWGPIAPQNVDKVDSAQAEDIKRQAEAAAAARKGKAQTGPQIAAPDTRKTYQAGASIPIPMPRITFGVRPADGAGDLSSGLGWAQPSHLGGPKAAVASTSAAYPSLYPSAKSAFLHDVHKAACAVFTTVLGPEANKFHRNHFHLDLAERKSPSICE